MQCNSLFQDGAIDLHVSVQQVEEYIPLVPEAGSHAHVPAIANVGNGKFEVHSRQLVEEDSIVWWWRAENN
jgi:hypothetical protein